jgi:hypothetical protein
LLYIYSSHTGCENSQITLAPRKRYYDLTLLYLLVYLLIRQYVLFLGPGSHWLPSTRLFVGIYDSFSRGLLVFDISCPLPPRQAFLQIFIQHKVKLLSLGLKAFL